MSTGEPSTTVLNGIDVKFPFEPYKLQKGYMGQVIRSLKLKKNALLESPTGTGKTLSILCASLSWLNSENEAKALKAAEAEEKALKAAEAAEFEGESDDGEPKKNNDEDDEEKRAKIYFSSRTHSQLSQSIKELKKTNYGNNRAVVLAGRDLLCVNAEVNQLDNIGAKNQACKSKIGKNCRCPFYKDFDRKIRTNKDYWENRVLDVEDLVELGHKNSICPFFASKFLQTRSDVIFLPYNYLLNPKFRKAQAIELKGDAVIFDEGHNIEKTCEDSVSVDLRSDHLATCIREMTNISQFFTQSQDILDTNVQDAIKELKIEDLLLLKKALDNFEMAINSRAQKLDGQAARGFEKKGDVCEPDWIFKVLSELGLSFDNVRKLSDICDALQAFLTCLLPIKGPIAVAASSSLSNFKDFLDVLSPDPEEDSKAFENEFKKKFRVYIELVDEGWILHIWCLSPSVSMKGLIKANVRSIILTSGTLAPLGSFEPEFETKFECRIQNNHIISGNQMAIFPVSTSFTGTRLDSSFSNKNNIDYYRALGDTVVDICSRVPDGVLLFFSSYSVMNNSMSHWKTNDRTWKIWSKLNSLKTVFFESRNRDEFNDHVVRYKETVNSGKGCIFFGICRGKLSEGIDLGNAHSRAVILIGLPYPALKEPRVVQKRLYLDTVKHPNFTSNTWYNLQMKRALNQAIGRAIRHKNDFGCVFLLDHRFESQIQDLSKWCVPFVKYPATYRDMMSEVEQFFENNRALAEQVATAAAAAAAAIASASTNSDVKSNEKATKKRTSQGDEKKKKKKRKASQPSQPVASPTADVGDQPTTSSAGRTKTAKKQRKHVTIEYDDAPRVPSASNRPISEVLADKFSRYRFVDKDDKEN